MVLTGWMAQWIAWIWLSFTIAALIVGGYLVVKLFRYEVRRFAHVVAKGSTLEHGLADWIEEISRGVRLAVIAVVVILMMFFTARALGHPALADWRPTAILDWLVQRGVRIVILLSVAYLAIKIAHLLASKVSLLIRPYDHTPVAELERQKRARTIAEVLKNFATATIVIVTSLMVLSEFGVNITPILTSLGVVGLGIGFGAQQLVGDVIAGFFHIVENQVRVGDVAVINGVGGQVEEIRLRTTVLRSFDGTVHVFRNGAITALANMTKDFSYFVLDLNVPYKEDTDHICALIKQVGDELRSDPKFGPSILDPADILGVEGFTDSAVTIKARVKTIPIKQWEVGREFRRRLKYLLEKEGVAMSSQITIVAANVSTAPLSESRGNAFPSKETQVS